MVVVHYHTSKYFLSVWNVISIDCFPVVWIACFYYCYWWTWKNNMWEKKKEVCSILIDAFISSIAPERLYCRPNHAILMTKPGLVLPS